mmetsp:Transcript_18962/g.18105  ORF Transcript_18962/g.18105 Transcript_18962/m.18105 type:complete len:82 (-) Transcript_18962:279-524(-)
MKSKLKFIIFLILGALGGCLFSSVCDPYTISVGFSTSGFAILAGFCIFIFLKFSKLGPHKWVYLGIIGVIVVFAFLNGLAL